MYFINIMSVFSWIKLENCILFDKLYDVQDNNKLYNSIHVPEKYLEINLITWEFEGMSMDMGGCGSKRVKIHRK